MLLKALAIAFPCVAATACAGQTHEGTLTDARYDTDVITASALVREALDDYPMIDRGNGQFETRWMKRGKDVYAFDIRLDGPAGGPFTVSVDTRMRYDGVSMPVTEPPVWLADRRDQLEARIYAKLRPLSAPEMVAAK